MKPTQYSYSCRQSQTSEGILKSSIVPASTQTGYNPPTNLLLQGPFLSPILLIAILYTKDLPFWACSAAFTVLRVFILRVREEGARAGSAAFSVLRVLILRGGGDREGSQGFGGGCEEDLPFWAGRAAIVGTVTWGGITDHGWGKEGVIGEG